MWASLSGYVAEYSAISAVFSLQSSVRLDAINNLKEYNSKAAQETLMDLTRDRDPNVRATAAVTLAKIVDEQNTKVADRYKSLRKEFPKPGFEPGQSCLYILDYFRLAMLLKDKDRLVRESSCVALGNLVLTYSTLFCKCL